MAEPYSHFTHLRCVTCGHEYSGDQTIYTCPSCGPLTGTLDVIYDLDALKRTFRPDLLRQRAERTIWRYHELLPVRTAQARPSLPVEVTPLYPLAGHFPYPLPPRTLVKDDARQPSGSSKDRATAIGIARARELGHATIAAASTGNAAASLATFAAREGLACRIFVPATAPVAKLTQIRAHGATLLTIDGTYDEAFDLCAATCARFGFYNRNTATNAFLGEGKKTLALEIWEQLDYRAPDVIVLPVGDGCILGGVFKGFRDLHDLGLIERLPRLIGVQAAGSAALARAWTANRAQCEPVKPATAADSISVALPRDQIKALRAVRSSQGAFVTVSDEAILASLGELARCAGIFVEPAAAASLAGLRQALAEDTVAHDEEIVLLHTGHGLKDVASISRATSNEPIKIKPDLAEVAAVLKLT